MCLLQWELVTNMYKPAENGFGYDLGPQIVVMSSSMKSTVMQTGQKLEM